MTEAEKEFEKVRERVIQTEKQAFERLSEKERLYFEAHRLAVSKQLRLEYND